MAPNTKNFIMIVHGMVYLVDPPSFTFRCVCQKLEFFKKAFRNNIYYQLTASLDCVNMWRAVPHQKFYRTYPNRNNDKIWGESWKIERNWSMASKIYPKYITKQNKFTNSANYWGWTRAIYLHEFHTYTSLERQNWTWKNFEFDFGWSHTGIRKWNT